MSHPSDISAKDFYYDLPEERIALHPPLQRGDSRLLVYKNENITADTFASLGQYLPPETLLVFNNTRVISARLEFKNSKGRNIEIFCLEPAKGIEPSLALAATGSSTWNCLVGRLKQWREERLELKMSGITLRAELRERYPDYKVVEFSWEPVQLSFAEVLEATGKIPLPPYIKRGVSDSDNQRYQTVYSKNNGSVAAPTAGLHFTQNIIEGLEKQGVKKMELTLHVGAGTFMPVKGVTLKEHAMHAELMEVSRDFIESLRKKTGAPVVAVGTTSLRSLESIYWLGNKLLANPEITPDKLRLGQWEPYDNLDPQCGKEECFDALLNWMKVHGLSKLVCNTQIIIAPPYKLRVASALITNFHQPRSTLLMLVAALIGEKWRDIYRYALHNDFRFLSYGDSSLLYPG